MTTFSVATVFGGSGFIGRYVVKRLARQGYMVRVAVRDPESALFLKPMGAVGQVVPLYADVTDDASVARAVQGADVVVNLVGILAETGGARFAAVHAEGAGRIAREAAMAGVSRLVHVSAIGADPASPSQYGQTKAAGEHAVLAAFPRATILRPSVVFGPEDRFFNRFASIARLAPVVPMIAGATRFQPVYVGDVADAIMAVLADAGTQGATFELGGPSVWTMREILTYVLAVTGRDKRIVALPMCLATLQAAIMERIPGKPLTRDQLAMLTRDNVVADGVPGLAELGIVPTPVDMVVPSYLRRFQPGGGRRPSTPSRS